MLSEQLQNGILYAVVLSFLVTLLVILIFAVKCLKIKSWLRKDEINRFPKKAKRMRKKLERVQKRLKVSVLCMFIVLSVSVTFLIVEKDMYAMTKDYVWSEEERGVDKNEEDKSLTYSTLTREYGEIWWKDRMHYHWYEKAATNENGEFDGVIDKECIIYYQNKFPTLLVDSGMYESETADEGEGNIDFEEKRTIFAAAVKSKDLDATAAWKAFKAGQCVQTYNYTSENVFQTGVLAEKSFSYTCNEKMSNEMSIVYLAGICEQWELFLTFKELLIGEGQEVSEEEVLLRLGKCYYNEARYGVQDESVKTSCAIMAYVIFDYLADKVEATDSLYLLCIYYSGHSFLNLMADIQDEEYRTELQEKEWGRWDGWMIGEIEYQTEGLDEEVFESVKEQLELVVKNNMG